MAKSSSQGRADRDKQDLAELKQTLGLLTSNIDRLSSALAQAGEGKVGSAGASAASGAAGVATAAGLEVPGLNVAVAALQVLAPILDKLVTLIPELNAKLQTLADISKAGQRVGSLNEEAARHGVNLSDQVLQQRLEGEIRAEHRATAARTRVEALTTRAQWRAFPFGD